MVPSIEEGRIVLITNPVSKSGRGAVAASEAARLLRERVGDGRSWNAYHGLGRPRRVAGSRAGPRRGLRHRARRRRPGERGGERPYGPRPQDRPVLAVIPVGSGNDYAETLGMAYSVPTAVTEILRFQTVRADVGRVNGRYFAETLSFGLDAAIALDTMDRRQKSGRAGTMLSFGKCRRSAVPPLAGVSFKMDVLGAEPGCAPHPEWDDAYLVAVQVGALRWPLPHHTQGAPRRRAARHLLGHAGLSPMRALALLLRARGGKHAGSDHIHFRRASSSCSTSRRSRRSRWTGSPLRHALPHRLRPRRPLRSLRASGRTMKKSPAGAGLARWRWCPRQDSNLRHLLRRQVLYPLSYEGTNSGSRQAGAALYREVCRRGRQIRKIPPQMERERKQEPPVIDTPTRNDNAASGPLRRHGEGSGRGGP